MQAVEQEEGDGDTRGCFGWRVKDEFLHHTNVLTAYSDHPTDKLYLLFGDTIIDWSLLGTIERVMGDVHGHHVRLVLSVGKLEV